jgi:hypothetical protein
MVSSATAPRWIARARALAATSMKSLVAWRSASLWKIRTSVGTPRAATIPMMPSVIISSMSVKAPRRRRRAGRAAGRWGGGPRGETAVFIGRRWIRRCWR